MNHRDISLVGNGAVDGGSHARTSAPARESTVAGYRGGTTTHWVSPRRLRIHDVVAHPRTDYVTGWSA